VTDFAERHGWSIALQGDSYCFRSAGTNPA
jgi:hypothetical protein